MEIEKVSEMLETRAALHFSVIGVGNAGNQLLNEVVKIEGVEVFAINSSQADLNNAIVDKSIKSFIVGDEARGAAKNRTFAKELLSVNGLELMTEVPFFTEMLNRSDVVMVAGSTAGGTGSGVCPKLIQVLKTTYPTKIIIYCGIIPRLTDSVQAQQNSFDCLTEITELNVPYILADLDHYHGIPNDEAYRGVQQYITDCIEIIRGKYLNKSSHGMIDENDMRTVIAEPGYLSIYNLDKVVQTQLDKESMQSMMIKKIKNSPAAEIMRDGVVRQMAAIINMPNDMSDSSKASDYEELVAYIGRPLAIFENYAVTNKATGQMIIILSGQSTPYARISKMAEIATAYAEQEAKRKKLDLKDMANGNMDTARPSVPSFLSAKSSNVDPDEKKKMLKDLFK